MNGEKVYIGLDIGSISVNIALVNEKREILGDRYIRHKGQPVQTVMEALRDILNPALSERVAGLGVTGSGGKLVANLLEANFVNEIIAQTKAVGHLYPQVRTVIEIGGQDSKLILLNYDETLGTMIIEDFSMNTICAAGTGSFLDQQASRLGVSIEEFGRLALRSQKPPRIAGRCSVFAKTDMIHLQQQATPDYDIVTGLCYALARNFKSNIGKGKKFVKPISFQGGVAANLGMVRAFEEVLELGRGELIIPKYYASMGAIGAALITMEGGGRDCLIELTKIENYLRTHRDENEGLEPLSLHGEVKGRFNWNKGVYFLKDPNKKIDVYLGIDVGSISTNVVAIDSNKNVIARRYLMTAGRPLEAVRRGLEEVGEEIGDFVRVAGVGTTGSGRYLTGDFVGADIVKNEITAQARAAIEIDSKVDTIFEIGGQDSKYISLENGAVVDFEMNKVCAAGTGSFLEEQAERLGIKIEEEFGDLALQAKTPVSLGERCTVFMESDLVHHQQIGAEKEDLVAGLSYSIVYNYLNRVVGDKKIGNNIFFQGGVAANKGVVAAFEKVLGKKITVPPHHDVTGAIGVAIIALEQNKKGWSNFKGFDLSRKKYEIASFECQDCPNRCEINKVTVENEKPLYYGSRCEKYDVERRKGRGDHIPDLFGEREKLLLKPYRRKSKGKSLGKRIGIPRILTFYELFPLWNAFFTEIGFEVVLSDRTNKNIIHDGVESVVSEPCFPLKVAHGHVLNLLEKKVDYIFLPSIINLPVDDDSFNKSYACPYVQTLPYTIKSAIDLEGQGVETIEPIVQLRWGRGRLKRELTKIGRRFGLAPREIKEALLLAEEAQEEFYKALKRRGKEILGSLKEKAIIIVSRPYNGCDPGVNLELPKKLKDLGVMAIPLDFLPLDSIDISKEWPNMYWRYGQKILSGVEFIRANNNLYALYLTNFGCGPDSFLTKFFRERMGDKPYLQIEVDEHSADVGAITRCEAFLDSLENIKERRVFIPKEIKRISISPQEKRKLYIPYMCDHAFALEAAFQACGVPAEVIPESDAETLIWGRKYTTGKECYPCIITTGDMVKIVKRPDFDPKRSAFFMPSGSGPCRFGQYNMLQRLVLDELGHPDVPIYSPNQDKAFYRELGVVGNKFTRLAWLGIVAIDLLEKLCRETRPYEVNKGETDRVYEEALKKVCQALIKGEGLAKLLKEARERFEQIKVERNKERPIIGVVGEIFVRTNRFSNDQIIREIERLGGEVWLPPVMEWFFYTNYTRKRHSLVEGDYRDYLTTFIKEKIQKYDEHRFLRIFEGALKNYGEPTTEEMLNYSKPYLDPSFEGEAVLSIGKSIDFINKGICGIVNTMPFTCMPGTVVTAISKRLREDYNNIPYLNMAYDGLERSNTQTRLEAFMYQCHQYKLQQLKKGKEERGG